MAKTRKVNGITLSANATEFDKEFLETGTVKLETEGEAVPVTEAPTVEAAVPEAPAVVTAEVSAPAGWDKVETAPEQTEDKKPEVVKLVLPAGTKETPLYLITPKMGKRERWFEKKRLTSYQKSGDGWEITLPVRAVKDRGILDMAVN